MKTQSQLPYETFEKLRNHYHYYKSEELKLTPDEYEEFAKFLTALMGCYIPCSACARMISLDEIYEIVNEEPVCKQCYEE